VAYALAYVKVLTEYLQFVDRVPTFVPEVLNRVVEYSQGFNTKLCVSIVGGAAVQSGVLKSITAKHLTLAEQSLGFVVALLVHVKDMMAKYLSGRQAVLLKEFDRVISDYRANLQEVHMRMVSIMEERLKAHCETLRETPLNDPVEDLRSLEPNVYMKSLVKETQKMHKIMTRSLHPEVVKVSSFETVSDWWWWWLENICRYLCIV
jgi:vacuolar protein sorting-associated protein 54